jgi:signal transduction histidine kinase/multidrug transporter EmrE-like cation transporter
VHEVRPLAWPTQLRLRPGRTTPSLLLLGFLGGGLSCVTLAIAIANETPDPGYAVLEAVGVALLIGVGAYSWSRRADRYGRLLVGVGVTYFFVTLALSDNEVVYSVGRIAGFLVAPFLLYALLAFPSGRLETPAARAVVLAAVATVVLLYLPLVPLMHDFPQPYPWGACADDCPSNAFFAGHQPGFVEGVQRVREVIASVIFLAGVGVLALQVRAASRLMRRTLTPVIAVAGLWLLGFVGLYAGRRVAAPELVDASSWVLLIAIPLIAVGLLAGMLRWRISEGPALAHLVRRLATHPSPEDLRDAMAEALEDPALEIAYRVGATTGYADADGNRIDLDRLASGRVVTRVARDDEPIAALVHDRALSDQRDLVEAAGSAALLVLDHHRLDAELRASVRELRESQARILAAADVERQRIERDLHDGAQQRLVALRMKLELMTELMERDPVRAGALQAEIGDELDGALEEIRGLARGIYPPLLASHGLGEALDAVAIRCPVATTVRVTDARRFTPEIETAVYFCCREALQNVAKHARGATRATVEVSGDDTTLRFTVADDGAGFDTAATTPGAGLVNMRDRVAVAGGQVEVRSRIGAGTTVTGAIPLRDRDEPDGSPGRRQASPGQTAGRRA